MQMWLTITTCKILIHEVAYIALLREINESCGNNPCAYFGKKNLGGGGVGVVGDAV